MSKSAMNWRKELKGRVRLKEPLKKHTTFKIGGPAKFFIEPRDLEDLKQLLIICKRYKMPFFVIGSGSNILVSDQGLNAAVFRLSASFFKTLKFDGCYLEAGSGASLNQVIKKCAKQGLSGAEFLIGIPGTVGGAIMMNAGQAKAGPQVSDLIEDVTVIDHSGKIRKINKKDVRFGYRSCNLSRYIILRARFRLAAMGKKKIINDMRKYMLLKKGQDYAHPSAGCIFKNPPGDSAGRLIDLCGLKGKGLGGASVSLKHANFLINKSKASAKDVLRLMRLIKKEVKRRFKINLHPEIKLWA